MQQPQQHQCFDAIKLDRRLELVERDVADIKSAFPRDELGLVNYSGHRQHHTEKDTESVALKDFKRSATKNILLVVISLTFTILGVIAGPIVLRWLF